MTPKLQQTIKRELERLPKEGQDAIATLDWVTIAEEIGKAHFMDDAQITNLQTETLLVLIGAVFPEFYAINIENHAGAIKANAEKIFNSLILGDWTAYHVAKVYGNEANDVPLIEKFKKLIK